MKSLFLFSLLIGTFAQADLNVVTTTSDIAAIARAVGGDDVKVTSIAKGSQDPHYIEAKPSFMIVVRDADLLISNGLSLEIGWLPSLVTGGRNPKVAQGSRGNLDLGTLIEPIDIPKSKLTRADGDVHPDGNPHFTLDPVRVGELAIKIAGRMAELDPANKEDYVKRAAFFQNSLKTSLESWKRRVAATEIKQVITYHSSLDYFLNRFGIEAPIHVENKPGIPPTAQHILELIKTMKREKISVILVDSFFDTKIAERIVKDVPGSRFVSVGIAVDSEPRLKTNADVYDQLVTALEGKKVIP